MIDIQHLTGWRRYGLHVIRRDWSWHMTLLIVVFVVGYVLVFLDQLGLI